MVRLVRVLTVSNRALKGQPADMSGFLLTAADSGGVHTNSGIPNRASYLITMGGTNNGYTVDGIGYEKAESLFYVSMALMPENATIADAAYFELNMAQTFKDLGFFDESDRCAVADAWNSVGAQMPISCEGQGEVIVDDDHDHDHDYVPDGHDICPEKANPSQADYDDDGFGDACDPDDDGDGVPDGSDNCGKTNADQKDENADGIGDACQDYDYDGVLDPVDNCPTDVNDLQTDTDGDGEGDACEVDSDGDGVNDGITGRTYTLNVFLSPNHSSTGLPASVDLTLRAPQP